MSKVFTLVAPIMLLMNCANGKEVQCSGSGFIYDSVTDGRAEVFNLKTRQFSIQGKGKASLNDSSSEFAGPLLICEDTSYWCIGGPLSLVIPKDASTFSAGKWSHKGISCETKSHSEVRTVDVSCRASSGGTVTRAEITDERGVVSYRREGVGDDATFKIRGRCGLFAN